MGRRKRKKPKGFSEPWSKPAYDMFTNMLDVHGPEKREALNGVSLWIAAAAALSSGFGGGTWGRGTAGIRVVGRGGEASFPAGGSDEPDIM